MPMARHAARTLPSSAAMAKTRRRKRYSRSSCVTATPPRCMTWWSARRMRRRSASVGDVPRCRYISGTGQPSRRAGSADLRGLGRAGGGRVRGGQGRPGRPGPLQGSLRRPRPVRPGPRLRDPVRARAQAQRAPRGHPAAHRGPRPGVYQRAGTPGAGRAQPRGRARGDGQPELRPRAGPGPVASQAVPRRPQRPARPALGPGAAVRAANARGAFWTVHILECGGYDGTRHFDFKPPRTEDLDGVWASAAGCMRNYLILRGKARAFRADPEVHQALRDARVDELFTPTLADGETVQTLRDEAFDPEEAARRGMAFERLDQLALEHLYGVRG